MFEKLVEKVKGVIEYIAVLFIAPHE